jgi:PKD repeat protein
LRNHLFTEKYKVLKNLPFAVAFVLLFLSHFNSVGQGLPCGSDEANRKMLENNPHLQAVQAHLDSLTHGLLGGPRVADTGQLIIIPIVFHIIHNYGQENISDEQVYDAVRILNEDFRKQNADTGAIWPPFKPIAADCRIEFRLANVDPDGNCTNGIDRVNSLKTYAASDDAKLNPWPRNYYFNVWVVSAMPQGVAGYAYKPSSVDDDGLIDGVLILHDYIGSIGTGSLNTSRALTHEIGHSFNLSHTWGNTNEPGVACGDDGIYDTPMTKGFTSCPAYNTNATKQCAPPIVENVQNYMDYSYCSLMYTEGQKIAMRTTLLNTVAQRNQLSSDFNLNYTGINRLPEACTPKADFTANKTFLCVGETVNFRNFSWRAPITAQEWTVEDGGTNYTYTDNAPTHTFTTAGWHTVTLKVTGTTGEDELVKTQYIFVADGYPSYSGTFAEDFENAQRFHTEWAPNSVENNTPWEYYTGAGSSGNSSMRLHNFEAEKGELDELISPAFNLADGAPKFLYFKYAGASKGTQAAHFNDTLKIYYNLNCGNAWIPLITLKGADIYNLGYNATDFVPQQWQFETFNHSLPQNALGQVVRFKFVYRAGSFANNFYMDDVNISNVSSVGELQGDEADIQIFPNPSSGEINLVYKLVNNTSVKLAVYDALGRQAATVIDGTETAGEHTINLNAKTLGLTPGLYTVHLATEGRSISKRLVVIQ